uniref:F-box family protein n=1 Tax=Marseillevirus LCMAC201 TaxID=2506605 RepID=A0A481YW13_9VIRU|nr:MAG: F-box family protein [Marseillevirus LCMAC201]
MAVSIIDLPNEILTVIGLFLPLSAVSAYSCTRKQNNALFGCDYYWKCRYIQDFGTKEYLPFVPSCWKHEYHMYKIGLQYCLNYSFIDRKVMNGLDLVVNCSDVPFKTWVVRWTNLVIKSPKDRVILGKLDGIELVPLSPTEIMICEKCGWKTRYSERQQNGEVCV